MRKKAEKKSQKSGLPYTDPYLNLVFGIFEKAIDDLTFECRNSYYTTVYQDNAYNFFFNQKTWQYKDFLAWCDLTEFSPYFWQKKAVMAVAKKLYRSPDFISSVEKRIQNKAFIAQIIMMSEILKRRKSIDVS